MKKLCLLIAACAVLAACDKKPESTSQTAVPAAATQQAKPAPQPEAAPAEQPAPASTEEQATPAEQPAAEQAAPQAQPETADKPAENKQQ
ncbi:hypothetical protein [Pseudomonas nitroreducens]|uniref:Lipoprotein n=1 Tax=Pseudomonas nitroreducens TaxID=46680 RepID=A0ABS0KLG2_PSENT|nr:hypothetical protein [Pseudomonas nitroreducens]MBG6288927.1 hypothetical protein [Pseudomonas nitroreducens]NMZ60177.1 hypothetical protein [Pseudomonas nitroreducens]SNS91826.1 biopolymer transport protein ExbB [Pseudomonas nitroreducens]